MNEVWTFYDPATGKLIGAQYSGPEVFLAMNTPPGSQAIEGDITDQAALDAALARQQQVEIKP